jgi:Peptidoglycan-synthase activator LpoB
LIIKYLSLCILALLSVSCSVLNMEQCFQSEESYMHEISAIDKYIGSVNRYLLSSEDELSLSNWICDLVTAKLLESEIQSNYDRPVAVLLMHFNSGEQEFEATNIIDRAICDVLKKTDKVAVITDKRLAMQIREERKDQQQYSSMETAKDIARELGSDYVCILTGNQEVFYKPRLMSNRDITIQSMFTLKLVNVESNQIICAGMKEIVGVTNIYNQVKALKK